MVLFKFTEYATGGDVETMLYDYKDMERITMEQNSQLVAVLAQLFQYVHDAGIEQNDAGSNNCILIKRDGVWYVSMIDFGQAGIRSVLEDQQLQTGKIMLKDWTMFGIMLMRDFFPQSAFEDEERQRVKRGTIEEDLLIRLDAMDRDPSLPFECKYLEMMEEYLINLAN